MKMSEVIGNTEITFKDGASETEKALVVLYVQRQQAFQLIQQIENRIATLNGELEKAKDIFGAISQTIENVIYSCVEKFEEKTESEPAQVQDVQEVQDNTGTTDNENDTENISA